MSKKVYGFNHKIKKAKCSSKRKLDCIVDKVLRDLLKQMKKHPNYSSWDVEVCKRKKVELEVYSFGASGSYDSVLRISEWKSKYSFVSSLTDSDIYYLKNEFNRKLQCEDVEYDVYVYKEVENEELSKNKEMCTYSCVESLIVEMYG